MAFSKAHPFFGHLLYQISRVYHPCKRTYIAPEKSIVRRWTSLFWDLPIFSGAFAVSCQGGKSDSRYIFPTLFIESCPVPNSLGPQVSSLRGIRSRVTWAWRNPSGCWPYEGLIKGNQWLRSPDHKALFLGGGYVRGRVG